MKTLSPPRKSPSSDYLNLIRLFPLRAIRSEQDHVSAVRILGQLLGRPDGRLSEGEREYAELLGRLIDDYGQTEIRHLPPNHDPLQVLRFLMEESKMNSEALGKVLGNKTAASLVLNGKRELSKSHIRRLSEHFKVDAGLFF